ncbi:M48 family metallopeptidase [Herbaspirillum robiniae]|uniref:M48 family metalloprotease n=1 Tax=Herbaspirillum robiniae TaxID=2014887 RepID=A0ABX2LQA3_9BURK|nr:M48 family metallopeptidase [Herbaspirillum robiniae]NUU00755.1 M48 family metalloprotease [Herbaspirillum robiniae]
MENIYPAGPVGVPEEFAKPGAAYKRKAWIALAGLGLFIAFYLLLAGWFSLTAYRLIKGAIHTNRDGFWLFMAGVCAAFFALFMIKALLPGKREAGSEDLEVTPAQQPRLFEFLYRLADEAGAPRPHRVFLSPRVNAAVFYELSVMNLFYPSKKNLEIGLGLVNVLSLGEFKAVCAHEFGHFAQRSMAVGRWVYTAQQIAGKIVNKRDALDGFLDGLSRFDLRVAWVGWIMKVIVWSIRAVVDLLFRGVVLAQRALSREMEMQADLVAVSLTGSDTLVHALHRLAAADDAWARTMNFAAEEAREKRIVGDVFSVQSRIIERLAQILGDPLYGKYPPLPGENPEAHRVFKQDFALPPSMWATHPLNFERENNAKRRYLPSATDDRSAWTLFDDAPALRRDVSARLAGKDAEPPASDETTLARLEERYCHEYFNRAYRGIYLGRAVTLQAERVEQLYDAGLQAKVADLERLYPESLVHDLERLRNLEKEVALLESLRDKSFVPADGVIRHRGRQLRRAELPAALETTRGELAQAKAAFDEHDRLCRSVHLALARDIGHGWEAYLLQLVSLLHYLEHSSAWLEQGLQILRRTFAVETAGRAKLGSNAIYRILYAAEEMYKTMAMVYTRAGSMSFDAALAKLLGADSFEARLGRLELVPPSRENLGDWLNAVEHWARHTQHALHELTGCTLARLLESEAAVAGWARGGGMPDEAPAPVATPASRDAFPQGSERLREIRPGFWQRFQSAQGWGAGALRLAVAGSIIGVVGFTGVTLARHEVAIYNGLGRAVQVSVGGASVGVQPYSAARLSVPQQDSYTVRASDEQGHLIEEFDAEAGNGGMFYNVVAAAPLVRWTATYGNVQPRPQENLGAPRWGNVNADVVFAEPPHSISTKGGGGGSRSVLTGAGGLPPSEAAGLVPPEAFAVLQRTHARWDDGHDVNLYAWLESIRDEGERKGILKRRLADTPDELTSARELQNLATPEERAQLCAGLERRSESAPDNADLRYLAIRCLADDQAKTQAFEQGRRRWPAHGWFAYATGYTAGEQGDWAEAARLFTVASQNEPALRDTVNVQLARLKRLQARNPGVDLSELTRGSSTLRSILAIDAGRDVDDGPLAAYYQLAQGRLEQAVARARGSQHEQRVLSLAAASSGASHALVERALAQPLDDKADAAGLYARAALAIRTGRDLVPYRAAFARIAREQGMSTRMDDPMYRFASALKERKPDEANKALQGMPMEIRGLAYAMGVTVLGAAAPAEWRTGARCLLFAYERPYFA